MSGDYCAACNMPWGGAGRCPACERAADGLRRFYGDDVDTRITAAVAAEREACAKLVEGYDLVIEDVARGKFVKFDTKPVAEVIRARGTPSEAQHGPHLPASSWCPAHGTNACAHEGKGLCVGMVCHDATYRARGTP
jgi:hypothetical protein